MGGDLVFRPIRGHKETSGGIQSEQHRTRGDRPAKRLLEREGGHLGLVGANVTENNTVENIESLFKVAKEKDYPVFVSPHYYYPTDHEWNFAGTVEKMMHDIHMLDRTGALTMEGFDGSGADWLERYKPYINDGKTVVTSPHKVYGPESNDLVL
ncbi:MAG: hypothetical protein ACI9WU_000097 [Myxococcota bacterium]